MIIYGTKEDLLYYALRRIHVGTLDSLIIKTSGEYVLNGELSEVVGTIMLGTVDVDGLLDNIDNQQDNKHKSDEFNISDIISEYMANL